MTKKKSIIWLIVIALLILFVGVFTVISSFPVGVYDYKSPLSQIKLGLDLKGGVYVTFEAKTTDSDGNPIENFDDALAGTAMSIQKRLAAKGYTEAVVSVVNQTNLRVEVPDVDDSSDVFSILAKPAKLVVRVKDSETGTIALSPENITSAAAYYDTDTSSYGVSLTLNSEGQKQISEATKSLNYGTDRIYFLLDGEIISQPKVSGHISGKYSSITGLEDATTASDLAIKINSGAYPIEFVDKALEVRTISPKLGEDAISSMLIAGGITLVLIFVFMILLYGVMGVAASIALVCYTILMILALAILPFAQLTLPGIAGIILGIGMAVDANIIIFERIKDEYRNSHENKTISTCIHNGFSKALSAILDSNITTIIGAIVLWIFSTGTVQGFAITLLFSIIISMISSLLLTRTFLKLLYPLSPTNAKAYRLSREVQ